MRSNQKPGPINGAAVKGFRQQLGLNQNAFAKRLGVSQGLVSQWEGGTTAVGPDSQRRLLEAFDGRGGEPSFETFLNEHKAARRGSAPLASHAASRAVTLAVYRWRDDFSLDAAPSQLEPAGFVTVSLDDIAESIAVELPASSRHARGDVMVFRRSEAAAPDATGHWLIQQRRGSGAGQVLVLEVKRGGSSPPRTKVLLPKGATYAPTSVEAAFRAVFEGRYL